MPRPLAPALPCSVTFQVLGRSERSLAQLLDAYCGVHQDKTLQLADWRVRPLPRPLVEYARRDVHWLLRLSDLLVLELMQQPSPRPSGELARPADGWPLLADALSKGHAVSARLYSKPSREAATTGAAASLFRRHCRRRAAEQTQGPPGSDRTPAYESLCVTRDAMYALCCWRDDASRAGAQGGVPSKAVRACRMPSRSCRDAPGMSGHATHPRQASSHVCCTWACR